MKRGWKVWLLRTVAWGACLAWSGNGATRVLASQAPANDSFERRELIRGAQTEFEISDAGATIEPGEPRHCGRQTGGSLWWFWAPPESGQAVLDLSGSDFDPVAAVYLGKTLKTLNPVACGKNPRAEKLVFEVQGGDGYDIAVAGDPGALGRLHFVLRLITAPEIARPPKGGEATVGSSFSFEVLAYGQAPLRYQWFQDGRALVDNREIAGVHERKLILTTVRMEDRGRFTVEVSNRLGSILSEPVELLPLQAPRILDPPEGQTIRDGQTAVFSVVAAGLAPLAYQWFKDGQPLAAGTAPDLEIPEATKLEDEGEYHVVVSNSAGEAASAPVRLTIIEPPANDDYADRFEIALAGAEGRSRQAVVSGVNVAATFETGEPRHALLAGGKSVWWAVEAPERGAFTVDLGASDFDTLLAVYTGPSVDQLTSVVSDDDSGALNRSRVVFDAEANTRYAIAVDGKKGAEGRVGIQLKFVPQPLVNLPSVELVVEGLTLLDAGEIPPVYLARGCARGTLRAKVLSDAPFSIRWLFNGAVIEGQEGPILNLHALEPGQTGIRAEQAGVYTVRATNIRGSTIGPQIEVTVDESPVILNGPTGATVQRCKSFAFQVEAMGCPPLSYQWFRNGAMLSGATEATLRLDRVEAVHGGDYTVTVRNPNGFVTSQAARLTVNPLPVFQRQPKDVWVRRGGAFELTFEAESCDPPSYEWLFARGGLTGRIGPEGNTLGWTNVTIDSQGQLVFTGALEEQAGEYQVVVSNANGATSSETARVTVAIPPPNDDFANAQLIQGLAAAVNGHNWAASKEPGEPDHAGNAGGNSVWWKWISPADQTRGYGTNFVDLSQSNFDTILGIYRGSSVDNLAEAVSDHNGGRGNRSAAFYPVIPGESTYIAVDGWNASTGSVHLELKFVPEISSPQVIRDPRSQAAKEGETVRFRTIAKGSPFIRYQWRFNGADLLGMTDAVLELAGVSEDRHEGVYSVALENDFGQGESAKAQLTFGAIVSGQVTDATNGRPLPGVQVVAGEGDSRREAFTDKDGFYSLVGLEPGGFRADFDAISRLVDWNQDVEFINQSTTDAITLTGTKNAFIPYVNHAVQVVRGEALELSFSMSPKLSGGIRFVLNWGLNPADLDAHLLTPAIEGSPFEIFFLESHRGSSRSIPFANLDHDVTQSFGPESITVSRFFPGTYQFFAKKFDENAKGNLAGSGAIVKIYDQGGLLRTLAVPEVGAGRFWNVAEVDGATRNIRIINRLQAVRPQGAGFRSPGPGANSGPTAMSNRLDRSPIDIRSAADVARPKLSFGWDFGDASARHSALHPRHRYPGPGVYSVDLLMEGEQRGRHETSEESKVRFITVTNGLPRVDFVVPDLPGRLLPRHYIFKANHPAQLQLQARDAEPEGWITRAEFYVDGQRLATLASEPYMALWTPRLAEGVRERIFMLSAHVYDQHGGEGTTTLPVEARDLDGDVLIVPSIEGPEIASLEAAVSEVTFFDHALAERRGLVPRVLMQEDLEYRLVRDFKLLIWSDVGDLGLPIQDRHVRVLNQAYRSGIPLYLMGEHLIAARQGLGREAGTLWSGLTRLDPGADRRPEAAVRLVRDGEGQPDLHPVLSAPFAEVLDFDYPRNLEPGAVNSPQAEVLAVSGGSDVMVAFPSRQLSSAALTGIRAIAQNFRVYPDQNEGFSSEERRALFQNAVCWLIDCDPCLAFNVSLTSSVVPAAVAVGDEVVFTIAAHHNGVCQAGGVVVESVLPENLRFVSAEASQGRVDREGQAVRFRLGILAQASVAEMTIVARALAPGPTAMTASVRANGANLANPVVTEPVAVEGILPPARPPELTIAPGGEGLEIQVMGQPARQYELQQSEDLVRWRGTRLLDSDAEGRVSLIVDASSSRRLFFRVREIR